MIEVVGNYAKLKRLSTGIYSMDKAVGNPVTGQDGLPLKTIIELYGNAGLGKSSFAYYLTGEICRQLNPTGSVLLCDLEGMDVDYIPGAIAMGGFAGKVELIEAIDNKGKPKSHETMLNEYITELKEDRISCGIVDSIGAVTPVAEEEQGIEEGFGAKRAVAISKFIRKLMKVTRDAEQPKISVLTNHVHVAIGGVGHNTVGGVQLTFAASTRIYIYNSSKDTIKQGDTVLANVIIGRLEKLRYGGKGREFKFVISPGRGVRPDLCALQDCVDLGIATRGAVVKIGETSFGRIGDIFQRDVDGDRDFFKPFHLALKKFGG